MNNLATQTTKTKRSQRAGRWRWMLMLPAGLCLLAGLDAALLLLDVPAPVPNADWASAHGLVMVFGFVGALICLERAVALTKPAGYLAPILLVLGGASALFAVPGWVTSSLLITGMTGMLGIYVPLWRRQRADAVLIQMLGSCAGLAAVVLWAGGVSIPLLLPWMTTFVVATIAGERVELARVQLDRRAETLAPVLALALLAASTTTSLFLNVGTVLFGLALGAQVLWLLSNDVARRTIKSTGAPRFMAACLLAGYFWLLIAAVTWMLGYPNTTAKYDTVIHAVFLGFVMSMIMAHASTILPAVLAIKLPYRKTMWVPALLLHLGLIIRLWFGDGLDLHLAWEIGGVLNVMALLLFVLVAAGSAVYRIIENGKKVLSS